nr:PREDICTED: U1 small nuclear ribonucleoprotein C-like [Bos indicus]
MSSNKHSQDPGPFGLTLLPGKVTFLWRLQIREVSRHLLPRDLLAHSSDDILLLLPAAFRQSSPVPAPTNLPSDGMDQGLPLNPGPRGASGGSGGVRAARGRRQRHSASAPPPSWGPRSRRRSELGASTPNAVTVPRPQRANRGSTVGGATPPSGPRPHPAPPPPPPRRRGPAARGKEVKLVTGLLLKHKDFDTLGRSLQKTEKSIVVNTY